jgi:hypothetical protein
MENSAYMKSVAGHRAVLAYEHDVRKNGSSE